jgi:hypothetical protein
MQRMKYLGYMVDEQGAHVGQNPSHSWNERSIN